MIPHGPCRVSRTFPSAPKRYARRELVPQSSPSKYLAGVICNRTRNGPRHRKPQVRASSACRLAQRRLLLQSSHQPLAVKYMEKGGRKAHRSAGSDMCGTRAILKAAVPLSTNDLKSLSGTVRVRPERKRAATASSRQKLSPDKLTSLDILRVRFYSSADKKQASSTRKPIRIRDKREFRGDSRLAFATTTARDIILPSRYPRFSNH